MLVGVFLNGETFPLKERKVLDECGRFVKIYQNANPASLRGRENRP